jgi:protein TonB
MTKPAESQPPISETSHQTKPEITEQSEQIKSEPAHSQNETAKPSGSIIGKKSNSKNIIEYKPDFTIDKMPVYPMSARRLGQQGTVGVNAYIDGSGKVLNVVAARSSGVKSLDEAAVAAVRCWSFGSLHLTDKMNIVRTEIVFKLE